MRTRASFAKYTYDWGFVLCYVYNNIPWEYVLSSWNSKNFSQATTSVNFLLASRGGHTNK